MGYLLDFAKGMEEEESIRFQADVALADRLTGLPNDFSFDVPITKAFNSLNEGYVSLGQVPDRQAIWAERLKSPEEIVPIKSANDPFIHVPARLSPIVPFIRLVSAFEAKHSPAFLSKSASVIVRDHDYCVDNGPSDWHRDPPDPEDMQTQNVYSFASSHVTEFDGCKTPEAFEVVCFTAASLHRRPPVNVPRQGEPFRRVFIAAAFSLKPSEHQVPTQRSRGGILAKLASVLR